MTSFVITFVILLWALCALVRAGDPRAASRSLVAKGARTLTRAVCWFMIVNISAISAFGVATADDGDMGRTFKMIAIGLVVIATVPVLVLRRLPVPESSNRHRTARRQPPGPGSPGPPATLKGRLLAQVREAATRPFRHRA